MVNASDLASCPTLFQERIAKSLDVRLTFLDGLVAAVGLRRLDGEDQILDIRRDNMQGVIHGKVAVPSEPEAKLGRLVSSYGLRFAAVDMAIDCEGEWVFFEINPNGQWAWMDFAGATGLVARFVERFSQRRAGGDPA